MSEAKLVKAAVIIRQIVGTPPYKAKYHAWLELEDETILTGLFLPENFVPPDQEDEDELRIAVADALHETEKRCPHKLDIAVDCVVRMASL